MKSDFRFLPIDYSKLNVKFDKSESIAECYAIIIGFQLTKSQIQSNREKLLSVNLCGIKLKLIRTIPCFFCN